MIIIRPSLSAIHDPMASFFRCELKQKSNNKKCKNVQKNQRMLALLSNRKRH